MPVNTVALLTDFGTTDGFTGVLKAVILNINPKINLVDITHSVDSFDVKSAAFILLKSFSYFPKKTVFLAVVDPGVGSLRNCIAIKTRNYYFVGPDNSVLSLAAKEDGIEKIVALENKKYFLKNISNTFHGRDIFAPVAAYLTKKIPITSFGKNINNIKTAALSKPKITKQEISGEIIYTDKFGNLVTNITGKQLQDFCKGRKIEAKVQAKSKSGVAKNTIKKIYSCYSQAKENELFLIAGSFSLVEISLKNKSAAKLLNCSCGDRVIIKSS